MLSARNRTAVVIDLRTRCHVWTGATMNTGYGWIERGNTMWLVHRLFYEEANGPISDGAVLHHICENRLCVNPAHLRALTRAEHLAEHPGIADSVYAARRNRTHCKHGHEYTPENTATRRDSGRSCRACKRADYYRRKVRRFPEPDAP